MDWLKQGKHFILSQYFTVSFNYKKHEDNNSFILIIDRYYTVLFGVSRAIGICSQVPCPIFILLLVFQFLFVISIWVLYDFCVFVGLAYMGPCSWIATWEAKKCYNGMAWKFLQESCLRVKFHRVRVLLTIFVIIIARERHFSVWWHNVLWSNGMSVSALNYF